MADTSVWIDHCRRGNAAFAEQLGAGRILVHPFVLGELALGPLQPRARVLEDLAALPRAPVAEYDEVVALVERRRLWGQGRRWIDVHLVASALLAGCRLWTLDKPLGDAARHIGIARDSPGAGTKAGAYIRNSRTTASKGSNVGTGIQPRIAPSRPT